MENLSTDPDFRRRPRLVLGGVASKAREAMLVVKPLASYHLGRRRLELGGRTGRRRYDRLLCVDACGAGDGLQGIKQGLMELADMLVVNKADGDMESGKQSGPNLPRCFGAASCNESAGSSVLTAVLFTIKAWMRSGTKSKIITTVHATTIDLPLNVRTRNSNGFGPWSMMGSTHL